MNEFMAAYKAAHGIRSAKWNVSIIPGGRVVLLHEPSGSRLDNGDILKRAHLKGEFYVWSFVNGEWKERPVLKAARVYAMCSRNYLISGVSQDGVAFIYNALDASVCEYDCDTYGTVCVSGTGAYVAFADKAIHFGAMDGAIITSTDEIVVDVETLVNDWGQNVPTVGWHCNATMAMFGSGWLLNIDRKSMVNIGDRWSVAAVESVNGETVLQLILPEGRAVYRIIGEIDCESGSVDSLVDLTMPADEVVKSVDLSSDAIVLMKPDQIAGGWGSHRVRNLSDGKLVRNLDDSWFIGLVLDKADE